MPVVAEQLGIGDKLKRDVNHLSQGERQRVAIARALAVSPRLLLMDEPLAAVDLERRQEILPWIEALHRELDIPVIHVSHAPEEVARLADHLVLMRAGQVTATGDMHEIFTRLDLPLALDPEATGKYVFAPGVREEFGADAIGGMRDLIEFFEAPWESEGAE